MIFIAIGEVEHKELVAKLESMWGDIPARDITPIGDWDYVGGEINVNKPEKEMSFLGICFDAVPERDEKSIQYSVLAAILGQGKSSVLHKDLVDDKQLTSNFHANDELMKNAGLLVLLTNCKHENVEKIKEEIFSVLKSTTITEKDLKSAVLKLKTDKKSELLSPSDTFVSMGYSLVNTGEVETIESLEKNLDAVTVEDMNSLLKEVVSSKPTISVVGKI
jgi:zinc protease